jgi:hypothetical protein
MHDIVMCDVLNSMDICALYVGMIFGTTQSFAIRNLAIVWSIGSL